MLLTCAATLAFYACGFGARAALLSLVTSWFSAAMCTCVYSGIPLTELFGMLPFSFRMPHLWIGLPFVICAVRNEALPNPFKP